MSIRSLLKLNKGFKIPLGSLKAIYVEVSQNFKIFALSHRFQFTANGMYENIFLLRRDCPSKTCDKMINNCIYTKQSNKHLFFTHLNYLPLYIVQLFLQTHILKDKNKYLSINVKYRKQCLLHITWE